MKQSCIFLKKIGVLSSFFFIFSCENSLRIYWTNSSPVSCSANFCSSVGGYNLNGVIASDRRTLSVFSTDSGRTFQMGKTPALPENSDPTLGSELFNVACIKNRCLASGVYNFSILNEQFQLEPHGLAMVSISDDYGATYTKALELPLPPNADSTDKFSTLFAITCQKNRCAGAGFFNLDPAQNGISLPYTVVSDDGGNSFSNPFEPVLPQNASPSTVDGRLSGISCIEDRCLAVGQYRTNLDTYGPLIAFSEDGGKTYTQTSPFVLPADADTTKSAKLQNITCNTRNRCIAVGIYNFDQLTNTEGKPLIMISDDGGKTFIQAYSPTLPADINPTMTAELNGIECTQENCISVGFYNFDLQNEQGGLPLILKSTDSGATFNLESEPVLPPIDTTKTAALNGVACTAQNCVAVGAFDLTFQFTNPTGGEAFSVYSNNYGNSFTEFFIPILPEGAMAWLGSVLGAGNYP